MNMLAARRILRPLVAVAIAAAALAPVVVPSPAHAWYRGGFFFGVSPFFYGPPVVVAPPPVYYGPPVYYAPPPVAYSAPPAYAAPAYPAQPGRTCFAGSYTCPLGANTPPGAGCACATGRGNAYGRAG